MRQFDPIDPLTINQNPAVVASQPDDRKPTKTHYILIIDEYAIIARCTYFTHGITGESEWLTWQLEMPKSGIPWIIDTLENKFFKLSHEGGLPKGVYHHKEEVDGEVLTLGRAASAGGDGIPGYTLATLSRDDEDAMAKTMSFSDPLLFDHGFFDVLKDIANRIRRGEL